MMPVRHRTSFPPSPAAFPEHRHFACAPSGHVVRCEFSRLKTCWAHRPGGLCSGPNDWPNGKSYPVTAAQLLPILTGSLAPIHFPSSQRTAMRTSDLRSLLQGLFNSTQRIADPKARSSRRLPAFLLALRKLEGSHRVSHSKPSRRRCTESNMGRSL